MDDHLYLALRPSRIAQGFLLLLLALVCCALWLSGLPGWLQAVLVMAVALLVWRECRRAGQPEVSAVIYRGGRWFLQSPRVGEAIPVALMGDSVVYPRLQSLHFVALPVAGADSAVAESSAVTRSRRRLEILLWPDSSDSESLRQLRVLLFSTRCRSR